MTVASISEMTWLLPFAAGFFCAAIAGLSLWWLQLWLDLKVTREETARLAATAGNDDLHARAWGLVEQSCRRVRTRKQLNPEWVAPLIEEIPGLVRAIAACYHPEADDPLKAPKLSEFTRAVQLTSADISDFLQNRRVGRLVDLSANRAWKTYERGREIARKPQVRRAGTIAAKLYRRLRPVVQAVRYKSPVTWVGLAVSNTAARTLQPAIINIVGRRAIQLYSGQLQLEGAGGN